MTATTTVCRSITSHFVDTRTRTCPITCVINDPEHRVNAVSQIVSRRVSSKPIAPRWYGPGEKIQFTFGFSLPVTVVGDPQLEFSVTTPEGPEFAAYLSGSGTKELVFSYTVLTVDDDDRRHLVGCEPSAAR